MRCRRSVNITVRARERLLYFALSHESVHDTAHYHRSSLHKSFVARYDPRCQIYSATHESTDAMHARLLNRRDLERNPNQFYLSVRNASSPLRSMSLHPVPFTTAFKSSASVLSLVVRPPIHGMGPLIQRQSAVAIRSWSCGSKTEPREQRCIKSCCTKIFNGNGNA